MFPGNDVAQIGTPSGRPAPWELLDDGWERHRVDLLIIGCGNLLRGDDAAGCVFIRRLWDRWEPPPSIRLLDAGTSGMDVAFQMRDADRVILVDASATGAEAGTITHLPAAEVETLPPPSGLASHDYRWDHALAFARWLLGPHLPREIEVYLIEGGSFDFDRPLSPPVSAAVDWLADHFLDRMA
ncbi:MAG: hydrogenase maturation protease [Propionibacteriaceae bacterium]|nr:hydrogenase maturation protease [Propionibacteriaceae bacterium]